MDWSTLKGPARIAVIGGAIVLVASILPWYRIVGYGLTGWGSGGLAVLGILFGVAGPGLLAYSAMQGQDVKVGPLAPPQAALLGAAIGGGLILIRLLTAVGFTSIGIYVALLGAAMATYGAYGAVRAAGLDLPFVRRPVEEAE